MSHARGEFTIVADGHYRLSFQTLGLQFDVKRLRWDRGELMGLLSVACDFAGPATVDGILSLGTFNLTSVSARSGRARELATRAKAPEVDFSSMLEEVCQRTIAVEERGRPILMLRNVVPLSASAADQVTIAGLPILRQHPTILFGDGGTGKSTLALFVAGELERRGISTLYLDWELNEYDHRQQLEKLFGPDMPDVKYRRCERALTIEGEAIAEQVTQCGIEYVVCDSVAFACDGPPESAEVAQRYFRALRQLRVGSLNLAHITKGEQGDKRPFGSTFWFNGCRACWYAERAEASPDDDQINVGLFHRKNNLGKVQPSIGFEISFGDRIEVRPANVADNDQLAIKLPASQRLYHALRRGPKTLAALSDDIGSSVETLERTIRRRKDTYTRVEGPDGITRIALIEKRRSA